MDLGDDGGGLVPAASAHSIMRAVLFILWGMVAASVDGAATFTEDFSAEPLQNGWRIFGDTNLFAWDSTNQNLAVTWDSSQTNSYFYHPFGTILAKSDDFGISFDLQLTDIAIGVNHAKTNTFEIAVGFINFAGATNAIVERGTGRSSTHGARNTCEFDYFPDSGHGATISPTIISSNNQFATTFAFPFALDPGALFHVTMNYTATNQTLHTTMTRNGAPFADGAIPDVLLGSSFNDFRLDQFAVINWSDAGADGSLLAHGTLDNFVITVPPPPIQNFSGSFTNNFWQVQFISQSNWLYTLEATTDFVSWNDVSIATSGNGTNLFLPDTNAIAEKSFYRVRADRP
jgi:hypothetical protein